MSGADGLVPGLQPQTAAIAAAADPLSRNRLRDQTGIDVIFFNRPRVEVADDYPLHPAHSLIGDEVGDGWSEPRLTQEQNDLAAVVGTVVRHMVQYLVQTLLESLTLAVLIDDGAHEVVDREVGKEGLPAPGARFGEWRQMLDRKGLPQLGNRASLSTDPGVPDLFRPENTRSLAQTL